MAHTRPRVFVKNEEVAVSPIDLPSYSLADSYNPPLPTEEFKDELPLLGVVQTNIIPELYVSVNLKLSQDLYEEYSRLAKAQELTVEEVIQHRLEACKAYNAIRGLWFSDSERGQLENLIQKWPLDSAAQAISIISRAVAVKFDDIQITLTPAQKRVLSLRVQGTNTPENFFEALVKKEFRT